jgi:hypothetical protein
MNRYYATKFEGNADKLEHFIEYSIQNSSGKHCNGSL